MNSISEQLLQAIDIITDEKIAQLEFDKTIQAIVYKIENVDTGEYKVRYSGNIFSAFSSDLSQIYKVDDIVYVTVPEGNFSNKKIITDLVSTKSISENELTALKNSIFEISPPFNILYGDFYDPTKSYGVIAGLPQGVTGSYDYIYEGPEEFEQNGFHGLFQQYTAQYELIRIQASFLTQFFSVHEKGNYGIEIEFYARNLDGYEVVSYRLDLNSFNGDPYRFSVFSPQSVIIKTQKNYLLGLKSIKLFEESFEFDKIVENGVVTDKENKTVANIFVKDISLQFVEQKDLTDTNYYLMISAPKGIAFTENISSLELVGRLIYQGKDIMDDKVQCQWYERDLSVMIGDERYNKDAGFGWRPLDNTSKSLSLVTSDIKHEQKYKLVAVYSESIHLASETQLFNNLSPYNYELKQTSDNENIKLIIVNNLYNGELVGDWYLSYPDGAYLKLDEKQNYIEVGEYLKYSSVIFYCAVYNMEQTEIIGTLQYMITNSESEEDVTISYIGEDTFRYDANGDIAIEDAEKERTLQVKLAWKEGYGTAYTTTWIMRDSQNRERELSGEVYKPEQSMIERIWVDNGNILHYNIQQKYKINSNNNTLIVRITTVSGQVYDFNKEILFLKDGDQGTNGTTYLLSIRPCDKDGLKLSGFNPLIYNAGWQNVLPLRVYVYKDGELINDNNKYDINYKWDSVNIEFEEEELFDRVTARGIGDLSETSASTATSELQFYVKAQADINDKINDRKISIYAIYPIDIAVGGINVDKVNINSIPSYIKYTSSGINPSFYNNDINFIYDGSTLNSGIKSLNKHILELEIKDELLYLKPASSFIFENVKENRESNVGLLKISYTDTQYIIHPIIMYLDSYGNEAINGWDGTALDTGDGEYVFAPQIGAGEKDNQNRFTGVVMGKDSVQDKVGLYGYQSGMNTFGLMQDGTAFFGAKAGGGQIFIDGRYGFISGGDVTVSGGTPRPAENGMYIVLADNKTSDNDEYRVSASKKAIGIGLSTHENEFGVLTKEENFYVTFDGKMRATEANIHGTIYANKGQIGGIARKGGWIIETNKIQSGSGRNFVALDSTPVDSNDSTTYFAVWAGATSPGTKYIPRDNTLDVDAQIESPAPFVVTKDGFLYATNAQVKGNINADTLTANKSGTIGGWSITKNKIYNTIGDISVGLASSGQNVFWVGNKAIDENTSENSDLISINGENIEPKFIVTRQGKMICGGAEIQGTLYTEKGIIGGWQIEKNRLTGRDISGRSVIIGLDSTQPSKDVDDSTFDSRVDGPTYFAIWAGRNNPGSEYNPKASILKERIPGGAPFIVMKDGFVKMTNAYIKGTIEADEGYIGSWLLKKRNLVSDDGRTGMSSSGTYRFWTNANGFDESIGQPIFDDSSNRSYFWVNSSGKMQCREASVSGRIEANSGLIGKLQITSSGLTWEGGKLNTNSFSFGDFSTSGTAYAGRYPIADTFREHAGALSSYGSDISGLASSISTINSTLGSLATAINNKNTAWVQGIVNNMSLTATAFYA